jgi:hypothetical protein
MGVEVAVDALLIWHCTETSGQLQVPGVISGGKSRRTFKKDIRDFLLMLLY